MKVPIAQLVIILNRFYTSVQDFVETTLSTTGNRAFAECNFLCRGLKIGHSAKIYTRQRRICRVSGTRQRPFLSSVRHSANFGARQKMASGNVRRLPSRFAECQRVGTRQTTSLPSARPDTRQIITTNYFFALLNSKIFVESSYST